MHEPNVGHALQTGAIMRRSWLFPVTRTPRDVEVPEDEHIRRLDDAVRLRGGIVAGEAVEQRELVRRCRAAGLLVMHPPNEGQRSARQTRELERQGLLTGAPDLLVLQTVIYRGVMYGGVAIELKRRDGTPSRLSPAQRLRIMQLRERGWIAEWARGADEGWELIARVYDLDGRQAA